MPVVQVVVIGLRAAGSVRRVGGAIVLPEGVHETENGIQSAHHSDQEEKKNVRGRDRQNFLTWTAVNPPINLLCSVT